MSSRGLNRLLNKQGVGRDFAKRLKPTHPLGSFGLGEWDRCALARVALLGSDKELLQNLSGQAERSFWMTWLAMAYLMGSSSLALAA